jgi:curved DNA-binding protein CbpA
MHLHQFNHRCYIFGLTKIAIILVSLIITSFPSNINADNKQPQDLYNILGVPRTATKQEIKSAYRRKALDTHPDKHPEENKEEAAEAFRQVVHAFEVLSDDATRRQYDRTGQAGSAEQPRGQQQQQHQWNGGRTWTFTWNSGRAYYQKPKLKDRFDVKEAQSRLLHIVSLEQLETVIVDENDGTLERNIVICFCPAPLETHVMDEMVYPWPFAAMSSQGIWWEDLLQATLVRFHRSNDLTKHFNIPSGDQMKAPIFVFGKRGQRFDDPSTWTRMQTVKRTDYDSWMWRQLQVEIEFVNNHDHAVEVYWLHDKSGKLKVTLNPGESAFHTTMMAHEWWVRDIRTDSRADSPGRWKLSDSTCLQRWKIVSGTKKKYKIPLRKCFDLSGHCAYWKQTNQCKANPKFMEEECPLTCGHCESDYREDDNDNEEEEHESTNQDEHAHNGNEEL